tara:strand:+ start:937 stop:1488 length:552 start_codon:yes stop_codon:yes gene_type:complete
MFGIKKNIVLVVGGLIFMTSGHGYAQTINTISSLDFGSFDFATSYNATIQLGSNGNIAIIGSGIVSNGGEAAGQIRITLPDTGIVDVKCAVQAVLYDASATDLTIDNIELSVNMGVAFGAGNSCQGLGGGDGVAVSIDMDALPDPNVYIGGEIVINTPITVPNDHTYSTVGAGTPIMLSVVVQ